MSEAINVGDTYIAQSSIQLIFVWCLRGSKVTQPVCVLPGSANRMQGNLTHTTTPTCKHVLVCQSVREPGTKDSQTT